MEKAVVVIPARYESSRFPGKPLALIKGKPMIQYVYEGVRSARFVDFVIIATDDERICAVCNGFVGLQDKALMTSKAHQSGTDRVGEVLQGLEGVRFIVNVQGDEPLINGDMVDDVIVLLMDERAGIATLKKSIKNSDEIFDINVVKVVTDKEGFALYFSRSAIPFYRERFTGSKVELGAFEVYKHIGIYGYKAEVLRALLKSSPCAIEEAEKLEQLRALYMGIKIKVKETKHEVFGVDTPDDLKRVEQWLSTYS
ncbi:MAG: 3-deoxy-manno-octulosonate cytidylyltransferase [Candidatus Magnetoovum sp. WYHC-5]|nr:3-deoxy-manno-octulosonate cytidylyltransferase [Candidatus Magnetoovum sp. WYHC-5]